MDVESLPILADNTVQYGTITGVPWYAVQNRKYDHRSEEGRPPVMNKEMFLYAIVLIEGTLHGRKEPSKTDMNSLEAIRTYYSPSRRRARRVVATLWLVVALIENPQSIACSIVISRSIEAACFLYLGLDIFTRSKILGFRETIATNRLVFLILTMLALLVQFVAEWQGITTFRGLRMLRPFVLINTSHTLAKATNVVAKTVLRVLPVSVLLLLTIGLFALLAMTMFLGTGEEIEQFGTLSSSVYSMLVLSTTANNPDVWMEAYNNNQVYAIFFILFTFITVYVITNVILATVYNEWKDLLMKETVSSVNRRRFTLNAAFDVLCQAFCGTDGQSSNLSFEAMREVFRGCGLKGKAIPALFLLMDKTRTGHINREEFRSLFDLMALNISVIEPAELPNRAKLYPKLRKMVQSNVFLNISDFIIGISAFFIIGELVVEGKFRQSSMSRALDVGFLLFSFIEIGLRVFVGGLNNPRDIWLKFDSLIVLTMCVTEIIAVTIDKSLYRTAIILRVIRLIRPMSMLNEFRVVTRTLLSIIPRIGTVAAILMTGFYCYTMLGIALFEGEIVKNDPRLVDTTYGQSHYWLLNFDNFFNGIVTLYCVMLTNNWFVIMDAYIAVSGRWAVVYFTIWIMFTMQVALNVLIGFVVDTYQYEAEQSKNFVTFEVIMSALGVPRTIRRIRKDRTPEEAVRLREEMEKSGENILSISLQTYITGDGWLRELFMKDVLKVLDPDDWQRPTTEDSVRRTNSDEGLTIPPWRRSSDGLFDDGNEGQMLDTNMRKVRSD
eukprot:CFRG4627T1